MKAWRTLKKPSSTFEVPKCSKHHATWKANIGKCSKYHAKWQVRVPSCCKYKANGTKPENKKKPKTILHPFSFNSSERIRKIEIHHRRPCDFALISRIPFWYFVELFRLVNRKHDENSSAPSWKDQGGWMWIPPERWSTHFLNKDLQFNLQ